MTGSKHISSPQPNPDYLFPPMLLNEENRAKHIIQSLLSYNEGIIKNNPTGANNKFKKLTASAFVFLRGTADLMYRDFYGTDRDKALALCTGDVHLGNYGAMATHDGSLIWGINDFDEAHFAPFTWDVKRGAISTILAAENLDYSNKKAFRLARVFANAYLETIKKGLKKKDKKARYTRKRGPKLIRELLEDAAKVDAQQWLKDKYLIPDSNPPKFKFTHEIQPMGAEFIAERATEIQSSLDKYMGTLAHPPEKISVLDVATKTGSGTASIGLWRYYALVAITQDGKDKLCILEIKQERPSVLAPYISKGLMLFPSQGSRVAFAEDIQLPDANPFYGYTALMGIDYLVRERSPYKKRIELHTLTNYKDFRKYAGACGTALAYAHLRSSQIVNPDNKNESQRILHSINEDTFEVNIAGFAQKMAKRVNQDWAYFCKAFDEGVFSFDI